MKIMKFIAPGLIGLFVSLLAACASSTDPAEAYKGETAQQIYQEGEVALRNQNYGDAIKHFEALDVQYPFGRDTQTAQLHLVYAYYKNSDFLSAETAADRFIHAYPTSPSVSYAYYMRGLSSYYQNMGIFERLFSVDYATRDLTQVKKAFNDFSQIETRYPESPYAPAAHQYMIYLRNVLANHQIEVAMFYFDRQAYVAAANRASVVVEHYQGAPVVPDALVIMVKSYHQLRQTDLENQAMQVLTYNYPDSPYVRAASGKALNSKKFSIISKQEKPLPPEPKKVMVPPARTPVAAAHYQTNGQRGETTTVADIVQEMRKNGWIKSKPQAQKQTAQQPAKTVAPATAMAEPVKKANSSSKVTLADVWNKISGKSFFSSHSKSQDGQNDTIDSASTATTGETSNQIAQNIQNGNRR